MTRVDKVFKEKDYYKNRPKDETQPPLFGYFTKNPVLGSLSGLGDTSLVVDAFSKAPVKNALAIIGAITVLYIGFKFAGKFAKMKESLKRI